MSFGLRPQMFSLKTFLTGLSGLEMSLYFQALEWEGQNDMGMPESNFNLPGSICSWNSVMPRSRSYWQSSPHASNSCLYNSITGNHFGNQFWGYKCFKYNVWQMLLFFITAPTKHSWKIWRRTITESTCRIPLEKILLPSVCWKPLTLSRHTNALLFACSAVHRAPLLKLSSKCCPTFSFHWGVPLQRSSVSASGHVCFPYRFLSLQSESFDFAVAEETLSGWLRGSVLTAPPIWCASYNVVQILMS